MLPHLSHAVHRLYAATSSKLAFSWTDQLEKDYQIAKSMVEKDVMQSSLKGEKGITVFTDAPKNAVCICLVQKKKLIHCASKVLNSAQRKWSIIMKEMYAISWGLQELRVHLLGLNVYHLH